MASDRRRSILRPREPETVPPSATWSWIEAVAVAVSAVGVGHLVRVLLFGSSVTSPVEQVARRLAGELVWIAVVLSWLRLRRIGSTTAFGRPARVWPEIRDGAVFGWILYGVVGLAVVLPISWLIGLAAGRPAAVPDLVPSLASAPGWLLAAAFALLVAPTAEELLFRGVLFPAVRVRTGLAFGVAGSAIAFGITHYAPGDPIDALIAVAAATAMGAALAIQYERRGTLVAPLSAHVAFNALGLAILLGR